MVQRVAGERQPPALDRVGEDDRRPRPIGVGRVERSLELREVVAAEIGQRPRQVLVRDMGDGPCEVVAPLRGRRFDQPVAGVSAGPPDQ